MDQQVSVLENICFTRQYIETIILLLLQSFWNAQWHAQNRRKNLVKRKYFVEYIFTCVHITNKSIVILKKLMLLLP